MTNPQSDATIDAPALEYRFNALTADALFNHYQQVGFIYPEKQRRLAPFFAQTKRNWQAVLDAGLDLVCLVSAGSPAERHMATLVMWRSTYYGWVTQHLTSTGNPFYTRGILLGTQVHALNEQRYEVSQNWFQPKNKYAARIFGSITNSLDNSEAAVNQYEYLSVQRILDPAKSAGVHTICCTESEAGLLSAFAEKIRGRPYALAEELRNPDIELAALNDLYLGFGLHRRRRCWLAFLPHRSEPVGAMVAYSGPLGMNFSFLENRCDLMCSPLLDNDARAEVCMCLLQQAAEFHNSLPLGYLPVTTDSATAELLVATGAKRIRRYNQSIWTRNAFTGWFQHVDKIFQAVERRYLARQKARLKTETHPQ